MQKEKVENDVFEEEINKLKNLINQLAGKEIKAPLINNSGFSAKEMAEIREALNKIAEHDTLLAKIMKKLAKLKKEV